MRSRISIAALLLAASVALAGCAGSVDGPVIEGNRRTSGTDAQVLGWVVIEAECAYLYRADVDERYPVIWPHGTGWDAEQSVIVLPNGTLVHDGDWVEGSGGHHKDGLDHYTVSEGVDLAATCLDNQTGEVAVFNSSSEIEVQP